MLNALEPGTVLLIHRHTKNTETLVMVRGKLIERFYDEEGNITQEILMQTCGENVLILIPVSQWHSLEVLEEGTVIFEAKDGAYEPMNVSDIMIL